MSVRTDYFLRPLCESDLGLLLEIELDPENKRFSTLAENPDAAQLSEFLHSDHNLKKYAQLRQVIDSESGPVGFIDLYDADFKNKTAGVGIIIRKTARRKGAGISALRMVASQAAVWGVKILTAEVETTNVESIQLFQKAGFALVDRTENISILELKA